MVKNFKKKDGGGGDIEKPKRRMKPRKEKKDKKEKSAADGGGGDGHKSLSKAYAIKSAKKAERKFRHKEDYLEKKKHIPLVERTPVEPPPIVVSLIGSHGVGKTTLIRNLIKHITNRTVKDIRGPITVVSKKRRITFIECNNDINSMIDTVKVSDISLLLIDASFGFEIETFEYLNICSVHGFPRIMGVLTHLDQFKNSKKLKTVKKNLKHRFWTEVYAGAKLFYLSGMVKGDYLKNEVKNLHRFISIMKFRPLQWRATHPYVLVDRFEDNTKKEVVQADIKCDRQVTFYGFARGSFFKNNQQVHIPGCGDFQARNITFLPDPCPLPDKSKQTKRRSINQKDKLIYAPFSGVGGVLYDKDAIYVDMDPSFVKKTDTDDNPSEESVNNLVKSIMKDPVPLDQVVANQQFELFSSKTPNTEKGAEGLSSDFQSDSEESDKQGKMQHDGDSESDDEDDEGDMGSDSEDEEEDEDEDEDDDDDEDEDEDEDDEDEGDISDDESKSRRRVRFGLDEGDGKEKLVFDDDSDDDEENLMALSSSKWKENLSARAAMSFYLRQNATQDIQKLVYGGSFDLKDDTYVEEKSDLAGGLLKAVRRRHEDLTSMEYTLNSIECTRFPSTMLQDWSQEETLETIKDCFVTGKWESSEDAKTLLGEKDDDEELYGDFEDLEGKMDDDGDDDGYFGDSGAVNFDDCNDMEKDKVEKTEEERDEERRRLKEEKKRKFDEKYDQGGLDKDEPEDVEGEGGEKTFYDDWKEEMAQQAKRNKSEFEDLDDELRIQFEGFRAGMYLRIDIENVPYELVENFDPNYPIVLGGLLSGESNIGYVQARFKKHRWYNKILKARDPLILSVGWRRFQTLPIFAIQDHNMRNRALKYTPQHLHCHVTFWGPLTSQGTGILALQTLDETLPDFRIAGTGVITNLDKSTTIMKKLKLVGYPLKIFKKTAFIKGMFNSSLEVTKFEGAAIRTVSGIRGQVKKAIKAPPGAFRATFEDKILKSDIVFMRTWVNVEVPKLYTPVPNLLLTMAERKKWQGMKTVGQLRHERGIQLKLNPDSFYIKGERKHFEPKPLKISKALEKELPYKTRMKYLPKFEKTVAKLPVMEEAKEAQISKLVRMIRSVHKAKKKTEAVARNSRVSKHKKELERIEERRLVKQKEVKKKILKSISRSAKRGPGPNVI